MAPTSTRSRKLIPAPVFFALWLVSGVLTGCASPGEDGPSLLATVGDLQITDAEVQSFTERIGAEAAGRLSVEELVQTLIDRQLLTREAQEQGLQQDADLQRRLAESETEELARMMLSRQLQAATVTEQEVSRAFTEQGWNEQVRALEIFVPTVSLARQVLQQVASGRDFMDVGRQFSVDPYYNVPSGEARQSVYQAYDRPRVIVEALFRLPVGGVSEPLPQHGGFVIAAVADRRKVDLPEVHEEIAEALIAEKRKQLRNSYLRHLKWDFRTSFHPEGMDLVVAVLRGETPGSDLEAAQRQQPVYAFEGFEMDVAEVLDAVGTARASWPEVDADAVNKKLSEGHFPNLLMARDARRKGVDKTEAFLAWRRAQQQDLMLLGLRQSVIDEDAVVQEEDLQAFYEDNKQRFRAAPWVHIQEILVEDPELARDLVTRIAEGADMASLAQAHSQRKKEDGLLDVSTSHTPMYGEVWMNAVMNAPLNEVRGPIKTTGGYSVFTVLEKHPEIFHTLESDRVRRSVTRDVRQQKERRAFNRYLEALRQKYAGQITVYEEALASLREAPEPT